ncbi:HNH endonuclease, partial [Pseudomonas sp. GW460-13]
IQTASGAVQGISYKHCKLMQRGDGYGYSLIALTLKESEDRGDALRRALSLPSLKAEVSRANG